MTSHTVSGYVVIHTLAFLADLPRKPFCSAESSNEILQARQITCVLRIVAFQALLHPQTSKQSGRSMSRADDVDHIEVMRAYKKIEMCINQRKPWTRAPVT